MVGAAETARAKRYTISVAPSCALQAAAGGGAAIIRALAKAVIAAACKSWRAYTIRHARVAAIRELHTLDDHMLKDIGLSHSEIDWVVVHGRGGGGPLWTQQPGRGHTSSLGRHRTGWRGGEEQLVLRRKFKF